MEELLRPALLDWLRTDPALGDVTAIEEEVPARATPPWLAVVASASADWSTKDRVGREVRLAIELHSRADDPRADAPLVSALDRRIEAFPKAQDGLEIASIRFLRARTERRANNARATLLEYRFRCLAALPENP
ncbi:hypothetical protein A6F68_00267 [Tsuneonella dongtanensis]|uniref:DUF3168 domain-containing protein n=1 Tax=Tsuneonella dongtanensis TaxID=692370 RepID=A0A1B2A9J0_9SPHN|nr:DUF3168 domain-containing protein [Tsuneonella dongtanensis]ANY18802.1 hypothetical protein A6F68_00267 [Tsuneonella dongtanensis]